MVSLASISTYVSAKVDIAQCTFRQHNILDEAKIIGDSMGMTTNRGGNSFSIKFCN